MPEFFIAVNCNGINLGVSNVPIRETNSEDSSQRAGRLVNMSLMSRTDVDAPNVCNIEKHHSSSPLKCS